jgi:TP901 family phage tail tape measure protein
LANKDDLSVNINVGVNLDKASVDEANAAIDGLRENLDDLLASRSKGAQKDFLTEIKKQLGFGADVDLQVGGYSIKEPLKKARQKAGRGYEKIAGGAFDGAALADKAETAIARSLNEAGKELAKRFNVSFVDDFAESMKDISFKKNTKSEISAAQEYINKSVDPKDAQKISQMLGLQASNVLSTAISKSDFQIPGDENSLAQLSQQIENGVEDFVVNALGSVTISPAMFIAAADRAMQNTPDVRANSETGSYSAGWFDKFKEPGKVMEPRGAFPKAKPFPISTEDEIARFDLVAERTIGKIGADKFSKALSYAISKDFDEIILGNWEKIAEEIANSKDIQKILKDDPTFNLSGIGADDAMANLERYRQERFIQSVREDEVARGYAPNSFASSLSKGQFPYQLQSAKYGTTFDELPADSMDILPKDVVQRWLSTMVEDGIKAPLIQALENPAIFGKGFISKSESTIQSQFTRLANQASGVESLSPKQKQEKIYHDQLMAQGKELGDLAQWLSKRVTDVTAGDVSKLQKGNLPQVDARGEVKPQAQDFAVDFFNAMRGGEFEKFKGEFKGSIQELEQQKVWRRAFGNTPMAEPARSSSLQDYDAASPDLARLETFLRELTQDGSRGSYAGMDTEHFNTLKDGVTELGIVMENGAGQLVDIFKFIQIPTDTNQMAASWDKLEAGNPAVARTQAKTVDDLLARAGQIGVPVSKIGTTVSPEKNVKAAVESYTKLAEILELFAKYNVTLTGVKIDEADVTPIKRTIDYINSISGELGAGQIPNINFGTPFDPSKRTKQLADPNFANQPGSDVLLSEIFRTNGKESAALGNLIQRIAQTEPAWLKQFESQFTTRETQKGGVTFDYMPQGGTSAGAHFAISDAAASVIALKFIEQYGSNAARDLLTPVAKNANVELEKQKRAAVTSSSGGGAGEPPAVGSKGSMDDRDPSKITSRIVLTAKELDGALVSIAGSMDVLGKRSFPTLEKMTEAETAAFEKRIAKSTTHLQIVNDLTTKENELSKARQELKDLSQGDAAFTLARRSQGLQGPQTQTQALFEAQGGIERFDQQAKAVAKLKLEVIDLTQAARQNEIQTAKGVVEELRKGQVTEQLTDNLRKQVDMQIQNTQAGKTATSAIKAQMQEQVNAQKAVQRQTQSLMNTWVTSRYALYDVGNFYQNVAQNLIRVSRQIFDTTQSYRRFETAFTSVERAMQLTGAAATDMRNQFVLLSETIPVAFEDIARIGTLGAQMGIASDGIIGFTETVSKFSAITNISAETVAQQFGRIAELADVDPTQFNNLGSAVAFAGVNAVATEAEILNLTQSIAAVSNQSGMTAPEIVGIATALASVGIQAEQARGVFTRVFADIDRAAQGGGDSLKALAEVTGLSAETISSSWGQEGAANEVFIALLEGLNSADNLTGAFDKLNIVETREINTLTRLAKNLDVVQQALSDSNVSFEDATFLGDSFDRTADNLDSKITLLRNNFDSLAAALSGGFAAAIASPFTVAGVEFDSLIDTASGFLKFLKGAEDSLLFTSVLPITAGLIALTAVFAGASAAVNKMNAQILAFRVAQVNAANDPTMVQGFTRQLKALLGIGTGMIEMRDQVSGANEKGLIEPVNFKDIFGDVKSQQKELLETRNIYLSLGEVARASLGEEKAASMSKIQLARTEADAVNQLITAKRLEIETLELSQNPADIAKAASMRAAGSQLHVFAIEGEIVALNRLELEEYQSYIASSNMTEAKKREALARSQNATVIGLETKAAAGGFATLMGRLGSVLGVVGIVASLIPVVLALGDAIKNVNKINLVESGGGLESLREAMKKDTEAFTKDNTSALAVAQVEYTSYKAVVDRAAQGMANFAGKQNGATNPIKTNTEEVKSQTIAVGDNTKEWLLNSMMQNETFKKWTDANPFAFDEINAGLAAIGVDFDTLITDMVAAANGADIDPLAKINAELERLLNERRKRVAELGPDANDPYGTRFNNDSVMIQLNEQTAVLEKAKVTAEAMAIAFNEAFSESKLWTSIREAFNITGETEITKLVDAYQKAIKTGKGLPAVMKSIATALLNTIPAAVELSEELKLEIQSAGSIEELIIITEGLIATEKAAHQAALQLYVAGGALAAGAAAPVSTAPELEKRLAELRALLVSAAGGANDLGGAAESAADKLARLLNEASSGVQKVLDLRSAFRSLGKSMAESNDFSLDTDLGAANISSVLSVIESIGNRAGGNFKQAERNLNIFKLTLADMGAPQRAIDLVNKAIGKLGGSTNLTKKQAAELRLQFASIFGTFKTNFQAGFNEVDKVENKIRSLTDFVSDLRGVLQSAFEIRYGAQTGLDAISTAWFNIKQAAEDAKKAVKSANDEINQSLADKTVLQYQLSVAQRYNDEKRAAVIRAKLAKLDQQILDQQQQLADANSANDKALTGNTKSAIDNRAKVRDLVTQYNSYLLSLANTNMSSTDLAAKAKELETDFLAQGKALGYAEKDLKSYTEAFAGDFTKVLNGVPRDITISVKTDPALRAIEEFVAKAQAEIAKISAIAPPAPVTPPVTPPGQKPTEQFFNLPGMTNTRPGPEVDGKKGDVVTGPKGTTWAWDNKNKEWDKVAKKAMGGFVSGPGGPTSDSIPAMLSNGEYVIQARSVAAYGLDFMNALNQQRVGFAPAQGSFNGGSAGGSQMVYLSPEDRALLRAAVDRPIALYTENAKIAQSANAGNVLLAQRGTN